MKKAASFIEPAPELAYDIPYWEEQIRRLSALFRDYPSIQASNVNLYWTQRREYFLDSEGRRALRPENDFELIIQAGTQGKEGLSLFDRRRIIGQSLAHIPTFAALKSAVLVLAEDLSRLKAAPQMESYIGPVLFEGQAAAEFFNQLLARNISFPRSPWVEDEHLKENFISGDLVERLGLRVVSPLLSAVDDPSLSHYDGIALLGHYKIDNEGIPAERVELISKGILRDILMSRSPIKERKLSNGHGRGSFSEFNSARIGNLVIDPESGVPQAELKKQLLQNARDFGLPYGLTKNANGQLVGQGGNFVLHAVFQIPSAWIAAGVKFTVGDIRDPFGNPIQWGGQIAQQMDMGLWARALPAQVSPLPNPCVIPPPAGVSTTPDAPAAPNYAQPLQLFHQTVWQALYNTSVSNPMNSPISLASNSTLIAPLVARGAQNVPLVLVCAATLNPLPEVSFGTGVTVNAVQSLGDVSYAIPGNSYPGTSQALLVTVSVAADAALGLHGCTLTNSGDPVQPAMPGLLNVVASIS